MTTAAALRLQARQLGFLACGVTDLGPNQHHEELDRWLGQGFAGTMRYLHRQAAKRKRPAEIVPGAVRAVVVLDGYFQPDPPSRDGRMVRIAKYARGRDYHLELTERLGRLASWLRSEGATVARCFADAGPVPERELAARAGLGWIGKNTMLLRPGVGSFFFIGSVLTDLELELDRPFETDHCGSCTRCLDACPTGALVAARVLDSTRCLSYWTIEHRGPVPDQVVAQLDGWAFGCDVCNDVCPWNERFAEPVGPAGYRDRGAIPREDPAFFDRLTEEQFDRCFADTPLERPGLDGMRRNYANAFRSLDQ
jgi:epoxyqueuosine reductase